jgi:hypothetical protein
MKIKGAKITRKTVTLPASPKPMPTAKAAEYVGAPEPHSQSIADLIELEPPVLQSPVGPLEHHHIVRVEGPAGRETLEEFFIKGGTMRGELDPAYVRRAIDAMDLRWRAKQWREARGPDTGPPRCSMRLSDD